MNIRNFNPADLPALARLCAALTGGEPDEAALHKELAWREHIPTEDRWVAEHPDTPGELVAHIWLRRQTTKRAVFGGGVRPDWRRRGVGRAMLGLAVLRAKALGMETAASYVDERDEAARTFMEQNRFEGAGDSWEMAIPAGVSVPAPEFPTGYFLRTFSELQHIPTLSALLNRAFYDLYGHAENEPGIVTVEYLEEEMRRLPEEYPPEGMYILLNMFGKAVGFVRGRGDRVDAPGVIPEERRVNLHLPLVLTAMRHLRNEGAGALRFVSFGDLPETIEVYKRAGFSVSTRYIAYQRTL
jgi:GNAT superfamily N-acetyltransferase